MPEKCPLCSQVLPKGITQKSLEIRMKKLPIVKKEKLQIEKHLKEDYRQKLLQQQEKIKRQADQKAKAEVRDQLSKLKKRETENKRKLKNMEKQYKVELNQKTTQIEVKAEKRLHQELFKAKKTAKNQEKHVKELVKKEYRARLKTIEAKREKDLARQQTENLRLSRQVDDLSRKLEKLTSEQRGNEAEIDLFAKLKIEFPMDKIERVGKGIKGADIVHRVISGQKESGTIIYESKNVSKWQNAFISKAKTYQRQYNTPYVIVVSNVLPKKQKGMCIEKKIVVIEPRMATQLSKVLRDAVVEIARYKETKTGRRAKEQKLYDYIISNDFRTRFKDIAETLLDLRGLQEKELDWHENNWTKREDMYDKIDSCRREVTAKISSATRDMKAKLRIIQKTA